MLPPLIQRPRRSAIPRQRERGVTMALVALAIFSIIAMAGLSIDVGTLYQASAEAQRSADQAALAGAKVLSLSGMTGDPTNVSGQWSAACAAATQIAQTVGYQNMVGGSAPTVTVTFLAKDGSNCGVTGAVDFGVNPLVQVQVVQANLPTYFARIWGRTGSSVSATATAEVFNPSYSAAYAGKLIPVQPRCVKPWIVPNLDPQNPNNPLNCTANCLPFIKTDGTLQNPGFSTSGRGVIGEVFDLIPDCNPNGYCNSTFGPQNFVNPPVASSAVPPTLDYLPGLAPATSTAVPSCGATNPYQSAIAGCDQTTVYQCGVQSAPSPNQVDLKENPGIPPNSDTSTATDCLIHQTPGGTTGQDTLDTGVYPYQIKASTGDPLNVTGSVITSSDSIVTVPIYDGGPLTPPPAPGAQANVNIVGFMQVFIDQVEPVVNGAVKVTVLNVAGCGTGVTSTTTALAGTSPVPVRLITPP
jgi:Flp pilus assembly protein TadG